MANTRAPTAHGTPFERSAFSGRSPHCGTCSAKQSQPPHFPGYDYATFYISDLGAPSIGEFQGRMLHSILPAVMNAGFIGSGVLFYFGMLLFVPLLENTGAAAVLLIFGMLHAAGIAFVGLVNGSPENEKLGLLAIHGLRAISAIVAGNLAAITSRFTLAELRPPAWYRGADPILGLCSALLLVLHAGLPDGTWERGSVYTFMVWELLTGLTLTFLFSSHTSQLSRH
ncbi:DUF998 domain-containing protein [Arthrobacter sp. RCC_34]|uniref:DUF998 domain-containing protein n=1 Tax=Arthrobacter sp. RCC_34 TaxID=3239230 RepID=UPI0035234085